MPNRGRRGWRVVIPAVSQWVIRSKAHGGSVGVTGRASDGAIRFTLRGNYGTSEGTSRRILARFSVTGFNPRAGFPKSAVRGTRFTRQKASGTSGVGR